MGRAQRKPSAPQQARARALTHGEPPAAAPATVLCTLCKQPIEPPESAMPIVEELLVDGQVLTETRAGLYHPGECHSQAVVATVLDRIRTEEADPGAN